MSCIRHIILAALLVFLFTACSQQKSDPGDHQLTLLVGTDPNYPPFEMKDSTRGHLIGFDMELMETISERNLWKIQFVEMPFREIIEAVAMGRVDMAISTITITPEREALVDFSDPYYLSGQTIALLADDSATLSLEDFSGRRVGVQHGTVGDQMARAVEGVQVFPYHDVAVALDDLSTGRLDGVVADFPVTRAYLDKRPHLKTTGMTLGSEYYGIAVHRNGKNLLDSINLTLAELVGDGTYDRMHLTWFTYPLLDIPGVAPDQADKVEN